MELLEKLDILSSKVDELLLRLNEERDINTKLVEENSKLRDENNRLNEQKEAVRAKVETLLGRL